MPKQTPVVSPEWLTKAQAAEQVQVSIRTITNWIKDGKLDCRRPSPKVVRISAASLERLMS